MNVNIFSLVLILWTDQLNTDLDIMWTIYITKVYDSSQTVSSVVFHWGDTEQNDLNPELSSICTSSIFLISLTIFS